jgi:energy-coupling factor transporter ATP-binding protein EcfA2
MHIERFTINSAGPIKELTWEISKLKTEGWHVLLGSNGSGKSTIVKSIALCLIGPDDAQYLQQNWSKWISKGIEYCFFILELKSHDVELMENSKILFAAMGIMAYYDKPPKPFTGFKTGQWHNLPTARDIPKSSIPAEDHVWSGSRGWFSASFGPYRRFTGGDPKYNEAYLQNPKAAPHISAFGEDTALGGALTWLRDQARQSRKNGALIIELVTNIINSDKFLPNNTHLHEVNEDEILFIDNSGNTVLIEQLGDGYRSALCICIELIHQLVLAFGIEALRESNRPNEIIIPGVVLIDEVDAHLHPTWQQHIGFWLTSRFPEMQFIVTTHSPLICQAATTVYKLPTPGTDEEGRFLDDLELSRLRYGNIFEAYASEAFGKIDRSEEGKKKLERLANLTRFSWERDLTEDERREQAQLKAIFIDSPIGI